MQTTVTTSITYWPNGTPTKTRYLTYWLRSLFTWAPWPAWWKRMRQRTKALWTQGQPSGTVRSWSVTVSMPQ